jgi:hypothetical protein
VFAASIENSGWPDLTNFSLFGACELCSVFSNASKFRHTFFQGKSDALIQATLVWATFWAIILRTHPVAMTEIHAFQLLPFRGFYAALKFNDSRSFSSPV